MKTLIIISDDERGRWQFSFRGHLPTWKRWILTRVIGWKTEPLN